jgi:hypothetical protein
MASNIDETQLLTWFAECVTGLCLTQASGTSTTCTQMVTSCANQVANDTGLTGQEKALITSISGGIGNAATQPSSSVHAALR